MRRRELKAYYKKLLPDLRECARDLGYCLAVHGSQSRDLDLIAVPWVEEPRATPWELAVAFAKLCGCPKAGDDHLIAVTTDKPNKKNHRECFHIYTEHFSSAWRSDGKVSSGYIELSVTP